YHPDQPVEGVEKGGGEPRHKSVRFSPQHRPTAAREPVRKAAWGPGERKRTGTELG
ncbi:hypothetical protein P7K49_037893, partial [Saguinus oedipus]